MNGARLPAIFLGHGNPMNALADNLYTAAWRELGSALKSRVRTVVIVSAHWATRDRLAVTGAASPGTLHDIYGFPEELYRLRYDAPGDPALARHLQERFAAAGKQLAADGERALDHGVWSVLLHMFPEADVPVVQLSYDMHASPREQVELGRILTQAVSPGADESSAYSPAASLRDQGVLLLASGNIVHNLREIDFNPAAPPYDWAREFDAAVAEILSQAERPFADSGETPSASARLLDPAAFGEAGRLSVPTPDHYIPFLNFLGMLAEGDRIDFPCSGIQNASISMRAVRASL